MKLLSPLTASVVAVVVAIASAFVGPLISKAANGQDIVGAAETAAAYVGTAIGFVSAIIGVAAGYVFHDLNRAAEQRHEAALLSRASAIVLKAAIRPVLLDAFHLFNRGAQLLGPARLNDLIDKQERSAVQTMFINVPNDELTEYAEFWMSPQSKLDFDANTAVHLAHLSNDLLHRILDAHGSWEALKYNPVGTSPSASNTGTAYFTVMQTLRDLLVANAILNRVLDPDFADPDEVNSVEAWRDGVFPDVPV